MLELLYNDVACINCYVDLGLMCILGVLGDPLVALSRLSCINNNIVVSLDELNWDIYKIRKVLIVPEIRGIEWKLDHCIYFSLYSI